MPCRVVSPDLASPRPKSQGALTWLRLVTLGRASGRKSMGERYCSVRWEDRPDPPERSRARSGLWSMANDPPRQTSVFRGPVHAILEPRVRLPRLATSAGAVWSRLAPGRAPRCFMWNL